jgi:hypothetical protein
MTNPLVINVALGKWYPQGQQRLIESLHTQGWQSVKGWLNRPVQGFNTDNPYTCKASALAICFR